LVVVEGTKRLGRGEKERGEEFVEIEEETIPAI